MGTKPASLPLGVNGLGDGRRAGAQLQPGNFPYPASQICDQDMNCRHDNQREDRRHSQSTDHRDRHWHADSSPATRWLLFWRKASAISAVEPFERVDLASILQTVCDEFTDVGFDVRHSGPDRIIAPCKPLAIMQAITNLCENGVKFGNAVEVRLGGAELGYNIIVTG